MFYLLLAILCSSSIAIIFKYSEGRGLSRYAVTSANYFVAFMVSLFMAFQDGLLKVDSLTGISISSELRRVVIENQGMFNSQMSFIWSILAGIFAGIFFFLSFIFYQRSVKENGVGLAGTFGKLGILVPMILSIVLWSEIPTILQGIGILMSLGAIVIVNLPLRKGELKGLRVNLVLLFLFGGMAEFSNKIFQKYAEISYKSLFLFVVFFTAFLISVFFTVREKKRLSLRDIFIGFLVGIPNLFSSFFLILALNKIKTSVAFPVYSAGTIVILSISGLILFKEKLGKKESASIVLTLIALVLINL